MHHLDENDLADFVARYRKPYDAESDTYDRPAFAADIKEGKNDPIYNAHSYHTKVPPRAIIPYILHYTEPGDLILDPFCGSGMTGVAALMCSNPPEDILEQFPELRGRIGPRRAILNDLSPAAYHIARNYCTPVDVDALRREFDRIKAAVKEEFDRLYGTEHYEPAVGIYAPTQPEVLCRLKQLPASVTVEPGAMELWQAEKNWELVSRAEIERRLGYPVGRLSLAYRNDLPDGFNPAEQESWLVIPATIQYTIWSDVYRCDGMVTVEEPTGKISTRGKNTGKPLMRSRRVARGCHRDIILWNVGVGQQSGKAYEQFCCPHCGQVWRKIDLPRSDNRPVVTSLSYSGLQRRKKGIVFSELDCDRPHSASETQKLDGITRSPIATWVPDVSLNPQDPQYTRNALGGRKLTNVQGFFTPRNLRAMSRVFSEIEGVGDQQIRNALKFVFTSTFGRITRTTRYLFKKAGNSSITGTLYFPSFSVENNFLSLLGRKYEDCSKGFAAAAKYVVPEILTTVGSATSLAVPPECIDYIFCDPPFGSNIYYSEVNLLWEAWLGRLTDRREEAVVHREQDRGTKRLADYAALMGAAFREMFRVLKSGRWATIEFNNSDGQVFEAIKTAVRGAGFEIQNMMFLDKEQKTFKQIKGVKGEEDVVGHDVIFNLQKPHAVARRKEQRGPTADLVAAVVEAVGEHLHSLPERMRLDPKTYTDEHRTTPFLNTMLMNSLIPRGVDVSLLNLPFIEAVCGRYFRKVEGQWYLRSEAVGGGNGAALFQEIDVKDEPSAIAWLRLQLSQRPLVLGEIRPLWMRAIALLPNEVSQRLDLEQLLLENFFRDPETNRWREPTEEERERMNDDRVLRVLHDAERFLSRTLRREPGDAEVCEWIDTLFRACKAVEERDREALRALQGFTANEGYRLICGIFPSVLRERVSPAVYARASKQADVASRRFQKSQPSVRSARKRRAGDDQPSLFDGL